MSLVLRVTAGGGCVSFLIRVRHQHLCCYGLFSDHFLAECSWHNSPGCAALMSFANDADFEIDTELILTQLAMQPDSCIMKTTSEHCRVW